MKTYDKFLEYYDEIVRGINSPLDDEVEFLAKDVIEEHKPGSKNILEVACGTGTVAAELQKLNYTVTGLDISQNMLDKAKKNMKPKSELIL
jgi:ubiquinone/menaquinone biosynthesis C-methylase UbiE